MAQIEWSNELQHTSLSLSFCVLWSCMHRNSLFVIWFHCTFTFFSSTHTRPSTYTFYTFQTHSALIMPTFWLIGKVFFLHTTLTVTQSLFFICLLFVLLFSQYASASCSACLDWLFHVQSCYWISGLRAYTTTTMPSYSIVLLWVNRICIVVWQKGMMFQRTRFDVGQCSCLFLYVNIDPF